MRDLGTTGENLLQRLLAGEEIPIVQLVQLQLDEVTLYLTTAGHSVTWGGNEYIGSTLAGIDAISSNVGEIEGLAFTRPLVDESHIAQVLSVPFEGRVVEVYCAWLDPATRQVGFCELMWRGTLNQPSLEDGKTAIASCTAEHIGVRAGVTKVSRYTDDEQRRLYPGDTSCDIDPKTDSGAIKWPAASYFKQG